MTFVGWSILGRWIEINFKRGNGMVYEIYFEPKGAVWRIRITVFYLYFFAVSRIVHSQPAENATLKVMDFPTFDDAERYARRVGIDKAYQRRDRHNGMVSQVNGVLAHGSSAS